MIFYNKLIKNLFLISTLILNIKAETTFNITYPDGTTDEKELSLQENSLHHYELLSEIGFSSKVTYSGKNYKSDDYEVFVNDQKLKNNKTMNFEDNKTYDVKIYEKKDYSIYFSDTEFSDVTNRPIKIKGYNLKIDDIVNIIVNYFFYDIDKNENHDENDSKIIGHYTKIEKQQGGGSIKHDLIGNIIYFKHFGGKLFELIDNNTKKEITNIDDYILKYESNYLIEFPIGSKVIHSSIGKYGYEEKYGYDFIIPNNKTLKDAFDFFLDLTNLDKNKIDTIRKKKDEKYLEIYVKKDVKEVKILSNLDKITFDRKGSCIDKCAGRYNRCSDDLKKVKYEKL